MISKLALAGTSKTCPLRKLRSADSPGKATVQSPWMMVIISFFAVEKVYLPASMMPTVAGKAPEFNAMDFTVPLKYSFTLIISMFLKVTPKKFARHCKIIGAIV